MERLVVNGRKCWFRYFVIAVLLLGSFIVSAQNNPSKGTTGSIELLEELTSIVEASGLELFACDQIPFGSKGETRINLTLKSESHSRFIPFLQKLKQKWNVVPDKFSARFNHGDQNASLAVFLAFDAVLGPGSTTELSSPLEEMLRVTEGLAFFQGQGNQPPVKEPHLLGMSFKKDAWPTFQIVAGSLDGLQKFVSSIKFGYSFSSLSRSSISGQDIFSLQLSLSPAGPSMDEFLGLFKIPSLQEKVHEITLERGKNSMDLYHVSLAVSLPKANDAVQWQGIGASPLIQVRAVPEADGIWKLKSTYALKSGGAVIRNQLSWGEILTILGEPWPPLMFSGMEFLWKTDGMALTVDYVNENEFALLRPLAEKLGFRFKTQKLEEKMNDKKFRATLTRSGGVPGPRGEAARPSDVDGLPSLGEVTESQDLGGGGVYTVKLPFADLQPFLAGLKPHNSRSIESFQLSDEGDGIGRIRLSLSRSKLLHAQETYDLVRTMCGSAFPWNKKESDLNSGLILSGMTVSWKGQISLTGKTLKSRQIFSDLFPKLEKTAGLKDTFFRSGTYRDHPLGRVMTFEVTAGR